MHKIFLLLYLAFFAAACDATPKLAYRQFARAFFNHVSADNLPELARVADTAVVAEIRKVQAADQTLISLAQVSEDIQVLRRDGDTIVVDVAAPCEDVAAYFRLSIVRRGSEWMIARLEHARNDGGTTVQAEPCARMSL